MGSRVAAMLIGGRAGSGKTSVAHEVSAQLVLAGVGHAHVEGDTLGRLWPLPASDPHGTALTERNLTAVWATYADLGCRRLVYANTVSVLEPQLFRRALGGSDSEGDVELCGVLLTASDEVADARLRAREIGSELAEEQRRSRVRAALLEREAPGWVVRVPTDGRTVVEIAAELVKLSGWA